MSDTAWLGICDYCQEVRQFLSEDERDAWEQSHPGHEDEGDGE